MHTATRCDLPSASVYSPSAWMYSPGVRVEPVERQPFALDRVLHAGLAEIVEDHGRRSLLLAGSCSVAGRSSSAAGSTRCGDRLSTVNGPVTRTVLVVLVGLVVQRFRCRHAGDGRVDLLARHALLDVRVVGDALERDVRHAPVDEALADVALGRVLGGILPVNSASFLMPSGESASR